MTDLPPRFTTDARGRVDPYRLAHKGIRVALARLVESAGRSDFADVRAREQIRRASLETVHLLRAHARIEALFLDPLVAAGTDAAAACTRQDHAKLESELFSLVLDLDPPSSAGAASISDARSHGHRFYLALTRLFAHYLLHMAEEETRALSLLHQHVDEDVLRSVVLAAHSTMSGEEVAKTNAAIAEAVAPFEREGLVELAPSGDRARPSRRPPARAQPVEAAARGSSGRRSTRHV